MNILTEGYRQKVELNPLVKKYSITLQPPVITDNQGDADRLRRALPEDLKNVHIPLEIARTIPSVSRLGEWKVTILIAQVDDCPWVLKVEPGHSTDPYYGLALDIGTTTVVLSMIDLESGDMVDTVSAFNGQVEYGEDILTRIYYGKNEEGLDILRRAVLETINSLVQQLVTKHGCIEHDLNVMVVAGNTTMIHLLLGLDPSHICREPYLPVINSFGAYKALEVGVKINPLAPLYCLPNVGSYVGGDVIAGILVSGISCKTEPALLVDVGTNGELVLGCKDWLVTCAGAAGPALEGGVADHGMRAEPGAIYKVKIDPDTHTVTYEVIGEGKPKGICGSGLIDCMAQMLLAGIIDRSGRFKNSKKLVVVPAHEAEGGREIAVSEKDIRSLLKTKAAVTAAVELLLNYVGCDPEQLNKFYPAGAFGTYIDPESAVTCGLYPDISKQDIVNLGNSSLEGAKLVLLSRHKLEEAERIAKSITYIELNNSREFMKRFTSGLFIPHMDLERYPSVKRKLEDRNL